MMTQIVPQGDQHFEPRFKMAHTAHHPSFGTAVLHGLARPFITIWDSLCNQATKHARLDQIQFLESLSDEELAQRGLRRDGILAHVYRDRWGF